MGAGWILVACLVTLRNEFNKRFPRRDKTTDGSIGNQAHAESVSDHNPDETGNPEQHDSDNINEVHAIDQDKDLRDPDGVTMAMVVAFLVARCRAGLENRLRYIIYNRTIWSASTGWQARRYTGPNPHDEHAHFSATYVASQEADTRPWGVATFRLPTPPAATEQAKIRKRYQMDTRFVVAPDRTVYLSEVVIKDGTSTRVRTPLTSMDGQVNENRSKGYGYFVAESAAQLDALAGKPAA